MNNVVGGDLLGKGGRELKDMSLFLWDLNLNNITIESLLLPKQVSIAFEDI